MSVDFSLLPDGGVPWLDASGPDGHIVLSTRIRLARNLAGTSFTIRASDSVREQVRERVVAAAQGIPQLRTAAVFRLDKMDRLDRQLLHEKHLVSKELAGLEGEGNVRVGAALVTDGDVGAMVNEEDHLRLQVLRSGFALAPAYADLERLDAALGARLPFAFHP